MNVKFFLEYLLAGSPYMATLAVSYEYYKGRVAAGTATKEQQKLIADFPLRAIAVTMPVIWLLWLYYLPVHLWIIWMHRKTCGHE